MSAEQQTISTAPLRVTGSGNTTVKAAATAPAEAVNGDSNTLKNKEFSNIFQQQQSSAEASAASGEVAAGDLSVEAAGELSNTVGGNTLPATGESLPVGLLPTQQADAAELTATDTDSLHQIIVANAANNSLDNNDAATQRLTAGLTSDTDDETVQQPMQTGVVFDASAPAAVPVTVMATDPVATAVRQAHQTTQPVSPGALDMTGKNNGYPAQSAVIAADEQGGKQHAETLTTTQKQTLAVQTPVMSTASAQTPAQSAPGMSEYSTKLALSQLMASPLARAAADTATAVNDVPVSSTTTTGPEASQLYSAASVSAPSVASSTAAAVDSVIAVPVAKPGWGEAVVKQVMWMSSQQITQANIALNPPELGPLQVQVNTQQDQASVVFTSQHSAVRDSLDQSIARLREMMENQGLELVNVDVSDQSPNRHSEQSDSNGGGTTAAVTLDGEDQELPEDPGDTLTAVTASGVGLVDDYA